MKRTQIPRSELIEGRWYVGRGRNSNVGLWTRMEGKLETRFAFLTISFKFGEPTIKHETYYDKDTGCFQPFALIEEGTVVKPAGPKQGWDAHYAQVLNL